MIQSLVCYRCGNTSVMGSHNIYICVSLLLLLKLTPIRARNLTVRNIFFSPSFIRARLEQAKNVVITALNGSDIVQVQGFRALNITSWHLPESFRCTSIKWAGSVGRSTVVIYDERSIEPVGKPYSLSLTLGSSNNVLHMVKFKCKIDQGRREIEFSLAGVDLLAEENGDRGVWLQDMALRIRNAGVQHPVIVLGSLLTIRIDITRLRTNPNWVKYGRETHHRKLVIIEVGTIYNVLSPFGDPVDLDQQHYHQLIEFTLDGAGMASQLPAIEHQYEARLPISPRSAASFFSGFDPGEYLDVDDRNPVKHTSLSPLPEHQPFVGLNVGDHFQVASGNRRGSDDVPWIHNDGPRKRRRHQTPPPADHRVYPEPFYSSSSSYEVRQRVLPSTVLPAHTFSDADVHRHAISPRPHSSSQVYQRHWEITANTAVPGTEIIPSSSGYYPSASPPAVHHRTASDDVLSGDYQQHGEWNQAMPHPLQLTSGNIKPGASVQPSSNPGPEHGAMLLDRPDSLRGPHPTTQQLEDGIPLSDLLGNSQLSDEALLDMFRDAAPSPQSQRQVYSAPRKHPLNQRRMEALGQHSPSAYMSPASRSQYPVPHYHQQHQDQEYTPPRQSEDRSLRHRMPETRLVTSSSRHLLDQRRMETHRQSSPSAYMSPASGSQPPPSHHHHQEYTLPRQSEEHPVSSMTSDTRQEGTGAPSYQLDGRRHTHSSTANPNIHSGDLPLTQWFGNTQPDPDHYLLTALLDD